MSKQKNFDRLQNALNLNPHKDVISIVGGGGKTSTLLRLGKELFGCNKRVILSTTTHLENLNLKLLRYSGDLTYKLIREIEDEILKYPVIVAKRMVKGDKIKGLSLDQVANLNREVCFDYMIIEADGSMKKSLKAPHKHESPVPQCTTLFIVVIGFDIIGKKLNKDSVHRPQLVARVLNKQMESIIQPQDIITILKHPNGLLKSRPRATRTTVILNKVQEKNFDEATNLANGILNHAPGINSVICGELQKPHQLLLFS